MESAAGRSGEIGLQAGELVGVHQPDLVGDVVGGPGGREIDLGTARRPLLGRDDHHAVRAPGAVDGRRRGIFQDIDGFDVRRVQSRRHGTLGREAVDDVKRRAGLGEGVVELYI